MTYEDRILEQHGLADCKMAQTNTPIITRSLVRRCPYRRQDGEVCGRRISENKPLCLACKTELMGKIAEQEALSLAAASPSGAGTETSTNA